MGAIVIGSALDDGERPQARHRPHVPGSGGDVDHGIHVLVGERGLLRQEVVALGSDHDAPGPEIADEIHAAELPERRVP
jgi:hypothetical protein